MKNVALIGVGPRAKEIYLNYVKKHPEVNLALVIDVESRKDIIRKYLDENGFVNTVLYTIDDYYKDDENLPEDIESYLLTIIRKLRIEYIIISTEPKFHYMYLEFALKNNINVLTDKPITVSKNMTSMSNIKKIKKQYYEIAKLAKNSSANCKVMCQRQYHRGYEKIKEIIRKTVNEYNVPITDINIFYSNGDYKSPNDLQSISYNYEYEKLFYNGNHFIDLLSDLIKINDSLSGNKKIVNADVYSKVVTPSNEINLKNVNDITTFFNEKKIPTFYKKEIPAFKDENEKNYHGLFSFYNKDGFIITTASLNLLYNGVSKKTWIKNKDFNKKNNKTNHEQINIQIGHLLNIQVHSYKSKKVAEKTNNEEEIGDFEHFDIYFFNNPIVDKKPFKIIHLEDLYTEEEKKNFLGYNELARETMITNFLNNKECKGDILDQALSIEILEACAKGIYNYYHNKNKVEKINVRNEYTHRYIAQRLKKYSNNESKNEYKIDKYSNIYQKNIYTFYNFVKYIPKNNKYEVYISINDTKNIAGCLLFKTFKNKYFAALYYKYLELIIKKRNMFYIEKKIENE